MYLINIRLEDYMYEGAKIMKNNTYLFEFRGGYKFSDESLFIVEAKNRKNAIDLLTYNFDIQPWEYRFLGKISDDRRAFILLNHKQILHFIQ